MKIARFQVGDDIAYGLVEDDYVVRIDGDPFGDFTRSGDRYALMDVRLLVPAVPTVIYAAMTNYESHAAWLRQPNPAGWPREGKPAQVPTKPEPGHRGVNSLIGHQEAIVIPREASEEVHYEGHLVAVIGLRAKRVSEEEAPSYVAGYTCGNDVSQRTWMDTDRSQVRGKNADTFKPVGPWIATDVDPADAEVTTRINGNVVQQFNTSEMAFGVAAYVSFISQVATLYPGDMIFTGTAGSTGVIRPGDVVEVEISGVGTLRNPVTREK